MTERPDDPSAAEILAGAEREMAEDEVALMGELIAERPDLREVAERLAVRTQFRAQASS